MADNTLIININGDAKNFIDEIDKIKKQTASLESVLEKTAKTSALAFAGFAATIAGVTKAFADYQKALVGVGKTTNIAGESLDKFGKRFQQLSSEIPVSTNELLGIAQAAGQLGVTGEENLLVFTETIAKLGVATDLTGEQAATSLTRILNVTGEAISEIDTFGSVIVALGNNFAATESEIVRVATEVSRSTAVFGTSSAEAAALATALKSVGVQAQLGGSAVGRAFRAIDASVRQGGTALENLSRITGIAGDQLAKTFEQDSTLVFQKFIEGLGRVSAANGDVTKTLEAFGLKGDEILKVLPVLAKRSELLGEALALAGEEAKNATALNEEARKAFSTLDSELIKVGNNFINVATNIGEQLAPAVTELLVSVNGLLKEISELDEETLSLIASFLKWGAIITGAITTAATFALGLLKLRSLLAGVKLALGAARIATIGFTGALTGGLSLVIGFLPEIITGVKNLISFFKSGGEPKTLTEINKKLEEQKIALERNKKIAEETGKDPGQSVAVQQIQARIDKLEELRKKQIETSEDFGTGRALFRPEQTDGPIDLSIPGLEQQEIPFDAKATEKAEATKKREEEQQAIIDAATTKRIEKAKQENEKLQEIFNARLEGETEEEKKFLQRKAEIQNEFSQAEQIKDAEERELALDNLALQHAEELAEINDFEEQKDEDAALRREERAALNEELRELDKEQAALINEEDRAALAQKIDTQEEAEKKAAQARLNRQIEERNQFKQDEIKFGTEIANLKKFFASEEVQGFKSTSQQLAQLSQSRNDTLKGIGKAAARVNAAIATAEGAIKAYTSLSGIPIIGPALGAAAAGALIAFGVEQQSKISAAQTGGFVPPTNGGARDRVPTLLEPGELVVPRAIAPNFIQAAGLPDTQGAAPVGNVSDEGTPVIEIMLEDRAGEMISLEQREGRSLGLIGDN